mgnify:CR=1 FL=1
MISEYQGSIHASVAWWVEIERWINPDRFLSFPSLPKSWVEATVGDIVEPILTRHRVESERKYDLAGVKWYGEGVFYRESVKGADLSATYLTPLVPGCFIYNRLFAWKASFAVVPKSCEGLFVSNEFPQFRVREDRVIPEYLYLFFITDRALRAVVLASSGSAAVSRNRFKEDEFIQFHIPLPPLVEQKSIVARWRKSLELVEKIRCSLAKPVDDLNARLLREYNLSTSHDVIHSRFFALDFKDLSAWDVKSGRASAFRLACPSFRPMGEFIEEATEPVRPYDQPEKDWPVYGVNNKEGVFLNSHQKGAEFNAAYKRIRKDWFFHNPTRCNVGSLGIVPEVPEDAITSPEYQVWRVKDDLREPLLSGFVAVLIQTPFFLDLVQFNRVGAVKQRMYTENLMQVRIPYLRPDEQRRYSDARATALADLAKAKARLEVARREVEEMILGTRKVQA